jgi:DNA-directed RNA polymerase specialized sigma24 family protein
VNTVEDVSQAVPPEKSRYQLSPEDRRKSVSPEARAKRRATLVQRRVERAEAALWLRRERQWVPEAIADYLGLTDGQVRAYLRTVRRKDAGPGDGPPREDLSRERCNRLAQVVE